MLLKRLFPALALLGLAGCDPQVTADYTGEPLLRVEAESFRYTRGGDAGMDMLRGDGGPAERRSGEDAIAYALLWFNAELNWSSNPWLASLLTPEPFDWTDFEKRSWGDEALGYAHVQEIPMFPLEDFRGRFELKTPPSSESARPLDGFETVTRAHYGISAKHYPGNVAIAYFVVLGREHVDKVALDGKYVKNLAWEAISPDVFVLYLSEDAPANSLPAAAFNDYRAIPKGFHLVEMVEPSAAELEEKAACERAAKRKAAAQGLSPAEAQRRARGEAFASRCLFLPSDLVSDELTMLGRKMPWINLLVAGLDQWDQGKAPQQIRSRLLSRDEARDIKLTFGDHLVPRSFWGRTSSP